jgi:AMP-polyphosphate phosphotransferase
MSRLGSPAAPYEIGKKKAVARLEEAQQRLLRLRLTLGGRLTCVFEGPV